MDATHTHIFNYLCISKHRLDVCTSKKTYFKAAATSTTAAAKVHSGHSQSIMLGLQQHERNPLEDSKRLVEQLKKNGTVDGVHRTVCTDATAPAVDVPPNTHSACNLTSTGCYFVLVLQAVAELIANVSLSACMGAFISTGASRVTISAPPLLCHSNAAAQDSHAQIQLPPAHTQQQERWLKASPCRVVKRMWSLMYVAALFCLCNDCVQSACPAAALHACVCIVCDHASMHVSLQEAFRAEVKQWMQGVQGPGTAQHSKDDDALL